jgi:chromosome segregation ATPase
VSFAENTGEKLRATAEYAIDQIAYLENELASVRSELGRLGSQKATIDQLRADINALGDQRDTLNSRCKELFSRAEYAERCVGIFMKELDDLKQQHAGAMARADEQEQRAGHATRNLAEAEARLEVSEKAHAEAKEYLLTHEGEWRARFCKVARVLNTTEGASPAEVFAAIENQSGLIKAMELQRAGLFSDIQSLSAELNRARTDRASTFENLRLVIGERDALKAKLRAAEASVSDTVGKTLDGTWVPRSALDDARDKIQACVDRAEAAEAACLQWEEKVRSGELRDQGYICDHGITTFVEEDMKTTLRWKIYDRTLRVRVRKDHSGIQFEWENDQ